MRTSTELAHKIKMLSQSETTNLLVQLMLPSNDPRNALLGTTLDSTGIRNMLGLGDDIANAITRAIDRRFA